VTLTFECIQFASGFEGQGLAELRTDQSPQIKESGLVDIRADCLAIFGYLTVIRG
jgi:hypothetical protein